MSILIVELEFNESQFHPFSSGPCYLFVHTEFSPGMADVWYVYTMSPNPSPAHCHVGDIYKTKENLSVTDFLKQFVAVDVAFGRGVILSMIKAKVRLKGMTEWIENPPAEEKSTDNGNSSSVQTS